MKKIICLLLLVCVSASGQPASLQAPPAPATLPPRALKNVEATTTPADAPKLTKFNLDFPGGNPKQLVAAIEKATGRPLNVVIPDEYTSESISALRMTQVTVAELFRAMELASLKTEPYRTSSYPGPGGPSYSYQQINTSISFQTSGPATDDSIWYFRGRQKVPDLSFLHDKPAPPEKICRVYALTSYLEQGIKVEDITTAIQTGWKMLGDKETPNISFHKETKLLIAVGEPGKLEMIDTVLKALNMPKSTIDPATGLPMGSFTERLNSIIQRSAPPVKPNAPSPKPAPVPESEP